MMTKAEKFFEDSKNKKICFIGIGVSHTDAIKLFASKGIDVTACDKKTREQIGKAADDIEKAGAKLMLGDDYPESFTGFDVVFRTPVMKFSSPALTEARKNGVIVTSELEVFFEICPAPIFAVTGSDGKTTTTTVISKLLEKQGYKVFLGGNIGMPLLSHVEEISENDIAVVELSSFQLISMRTSPNVAVITNVAPNHLDWHVDMQEYIDAKKNLYAHQNAFSRTVLNLDNEVTKGFASETRGDTLMFSRKEKVARGTYIDDNGYIVAVDEQGEHKLFSQDEIRIPGKHNVENYLAAIAAVWGFVSQGNIEQVAKTFGGVEHRIEFVRELDGVKWYNDSIATSPTRTIAGLNSFGQKLIIIAGGYDKHIPFEPLVPKLCEKVKTLILMAQTAPLIRSAVEAYPEYESCGMKMIMVETMQQAIDTARAEAKPGDIVSLSPACASFGMYKNFEERGVDFKTRVNNLK